MKTGLHRHLWRSLSVAAVGIVAVVLTACTGGGGGRLPPDGVTFTSGDVRLQLQLRALG
jgi:hypothetical protein